MIYNGRGINIYEYYIFCDILPAVTGSALGDFGMRLTKDYFYTFPGPGLGVKKSTVIIRLTLFN